MNVCRYDVKGTSQKDALNKLKLELQDARQRNKRLDALGVKQRSRGLIIFKDGQYIND